LRAPPALKGRAIAVTPAILAIGTDIALEFDPLGVAAVQCAAEPPFCGFTRLSHIFAVFSGEIQCRPKTLSYFRQSSIP
jgi:hypothetical protein